MYELFQPTLEELQKWETALVRLLPHIAVSIIILLCAVASGKLLRKILRKILGKWYGKAASGAEVSAIAGNFAYLLVVIVGLILITSVLGLDNLFTSLLASAGVVGIVLGYAFKDVASNFFAGAAISLRSPYKAGDLVEIGDFFGAVSRVDILYTSIASRDGQMVYMPNQYIFSNTIMNYNTFNHRRVVLKTGVAYGDNLEHVEKVALQTIEGLPFVKQDHPIQLFFTGIGGSSYNFELRFWIDYETQAQYRAAMSEAIRSLKSAFEQNDISIPYPVQSLDFGVKGGVNISDIDFRASDT